MVTILPQECRSFHPGLKKVVVGWGEITEQLGEAEPVVVFVYSVNMFSHIK